MDTPPTLIPDVLPIRAEALTLPETARTLTIVDDPSFTAASAVLVRIKSLRTTIDALFAPHIARAWEAHRALIADRRRLDAPLTEAEAALKRQLAAYSLAEEARREADARRRMAEAQAHRLAEIRVEAHDLEVAGYPTEAADLLAGLDRAPAMPIAILPVPVTAPGIRCREVWRYEVLEADHVPREYLTIDHPKLEGVVRALKSAAHIPGVRIWAERAIAASGRAR